MNSANSENDPRKNRLPFLFIAATTIIAILISLYSLYSGSFIIFQNFFYIPIILSCMYYKTRGFIYSVCLALIYLLLILFFASESIIIIMQALVRVVVFIGIAGIVTFLSINHKRAEEKLQKSEAKYRSIFDNAVEGIFQTTPDGHFLSANPAMARMLGYDSPEELISSVTSIGEQLYVNPEERSTLINMLKEKGTVEGFELQQRKKDGSLFWALVNVRTVKDEAGNILCLEGTHEDITSRKLSEEKLRKSLTGTIQALSSTVETRDPYTAGHQRKVSNLARTIAQEMGLPSDTVDIIRMAGIIHDIGKISVPAEILSKPGRITDIEMSLIKVHSQSGYDILKDVGLPYPVAGIVLQHHEKLDGSGYPQGLKGYQILLEAQIISVADAVEAISSVRPYRPGFGIEVALQEIEKNKGVFYDEKAVEVCVKLFREKRFTFE